MEYLVLLTISKMKNRKHVRNRRKYEGGYIGAAISAGGSLLGGLLANKAQRDQANRANRFSQASTARQMAFQERMSNTAHQRQVKDLRAAGLNPILSAKYGGATTPSGSSFTGQQAQQRDVITPAAQNYWSAKQAAAGVENTQAQTQLTHAQTIKTGRETRNLDDSQQEIQARTIHTKRQAMTEMERAWNINRATAKIIVETKSAKLRMRLMKNELKISQQQFKEMITRFPGIRTEGEIDATLWGILMRYIMRANILVPTSSYKLGPRVKVGSDPQIPFSY